MREAFVIPLMLIMACDLVAAEGLTMDPSRIHLSTLRYRTSLLPVANSPEFHEWSAELFGAVKDNLGGPPLKSVTYPSFHSDGTRFLLYLRLGGGSGNANSHFFTYENEVWTVNTEQGSKFIDRQWSGGDKTVNAYPLPAAFHQGRMHLAWSWRDTPDPKTSHDLCYAYSEDGGKNWMNNEGHPVGTTGSRFITADTPGISIYDIPTGTSFINGGSMDVDPDGHVHILMRGEDGSPAHFQRDPTTGKWLREKAGSLGALHAGSGGSLHILTPEGIMKRTPGGFQEIQNYPPGTSACFKDSKPAIDSLRVSFDGWVSMIGQNGKTVKVVDYRLVP